MTTPEIPEPPQSPPPPPRSPFQAPSNEQESMQFPDPMAEDKVSGPAIGLIVTGVIGCLYAIVNLVMSGSETQLQMMEEMYGDMEGIDTMMGIMQSVGIVMPLIGIAVSFLIIFGALKMKKLESYGLSMAAAIVAMIPCLSPCCVLGLPIGIWALVVIMKPEIKECFKP